MKNRYTSFVIIIFFFQAEDGIRDLTVTGVQTCALPIYTDNTEVYKLWDIELRKVVYSKDIEILEGVFHPFRRNNTILEELEDEPLQVSESEEEPKESEANKSHRSESVRGPPHVMFYVKCFAWY